MNKTKLWLGIGSFVLAGSLAETQTIGTAIAGPQIGPSIGGFANSHLTRIAETEPAGEGGEQGGRAIALEEEMLAHAEFRNPERIPVGTGVVIEGTGPIRGDQLR